MSLWHFPPLDADDFVLAFARCFTHHLLTTAIIGFVNCRQTLPFFRMPPRRSPSGELSALGGGGGRALGGASRRSALDPREARLQALEGRNHRDPDDAGLPSV